MQIAVSNQKGGAGKTTTTLNVAGALNERGHDVLVVDLDPQGHATEGLGFEDLYRADRESLFNLLPDLDAMDRLDELVVSHDEMDLVPAHIDMINLADELAAVRRREERLGMLLEDVDAYDYVLVDCPPNLGVLTDNAIVATGNVLIPAEAKSTSIRALEILFEQLRGIESAFGEEVRELGLVANEVQVDGEGEEMMAWFRDVFESRERGEVFEIRKRVALQRAWNNGVSIFEHSEECDAEAEYLRIAEHLEGFDDE